MFCSSSRLTLVETVCRLVSMTGVSDDDVDFLGQAADAQRDAEGNNRAGVDRHVLVPVVGEPGELGGHGVAPGREVDEVRLALGVRDGDVGLGADRLDRHAGQHRAGAVLDGDVDAARVDLRCDRRRDERRRRRATGRPGPIVFSSDPPLCDPTRRRSAHDAGTAGPRTHCEAHVERVGCYAAWIWPDAPAVNEIEENCGLAGTSRRVFGD